jgi:hypothetical protein
MAPRRAESQEVRRLAGCLPPAASVRNNLYREVSHARVTRPVTPPAAA